MGIEQRETVKNVFSDHWCDDCVYFQEHSQTCTLATTKPIPKSRTCGSWEQKTMLGIRHRR